MLDTPLSVFYGAGPGLPAAGTPSTASGPLESGGHWERSDNGLNWSYKEFDASGNLTFSEAGRYGQTPEEAVTAGQHAPIDAQHPADLPIGEDLNEITADKVVNGHGPQAHREPYNDQSGDFVGSTDGGMVIRNGRSRPLAEVQQMDQSHPHMTPPGWDTFFGTDGSTPRSDQWYAQHGELVDLHNTVLHQLERLQEAKNPAQQKILLDALKTNLEIARVKQRELGLDDRVGHSIENFAERWQKARPDSALWAGASAFWHSPGTQIAGGFIPGVGEAMDLEVLLDRDADGASKVLAALSLAVSAVTLGFTPNFGGALRAAGDTLDLADDAARQGRKLTGYTPQANAGDVLGQVDEVALERLQLAGQIEIPAGTQGIRKLMSDLSVVSGNEVALVRSESGRRFLVMGGPNAIRLPPYVAKVIAHTHPKGRLRFSDADLRSLRKRGQRSSVIISPWDDFGIRLPVGGY